MASVASMLSIEKEQQLAELFPVPVRFHLLYKGSHHGFDIDTMMYPATEVDKVGGFLILVFLDDGDIRGGYMSHPPVEKHPDEDAFLFELKKYGSRQFKTLNPQTAVIYNRGDMVSFGECLTLKQETVNWRFVKFSSSDKYQITGWNDKLSVDVELHRVENMGGVPKLKAWREMTWDAMSLRQNLEAFKPACKSMKQVRVLLLGPTGSGKSSFINSVRSGLYGRVGHLPVFGPGVNRKMKSYTMKSGSGDHNQPTALTFVDVLALGDSVTPGLSPSDALAVIKGHVPEGTMFNSDAPISAQTEGYRPNPTLGDKIHCVVFVLDASELSTYSEELKNAMKTIQIGMANLTPDVAQMVLLTRVDQVCLSVKQSLRSVYTSPVLQSKMQQAAKMMSLPLSLVFPVKNYHKEISVDTDTDVLILTVAQFILNTVDDVLEDYEEPSET